MSRPGASSTALGRFAGPEADDLTVVCRADPGEGDAACQAEGIYRELIAVLAAERSSTRDVGRETLFLRDVRRDLPRVLEVRARVLAEACQESEAPWPAFIEQAPVDARARVELAAAAVIPRRRDAWAVRDVHAAAACPCEGCRRSGARLVRLGDETALHTTNVYGAGDDAFAEALDMFGAAERLLAQCGMGFGDVVRTWVHLRDIARDYDALNAARREFFGQHGVDPRPASTGVQGGPFPDAHDFSLTVSALRSTWPIRRTPMSTPLLSQAWTYGADFSRGLRVVEAGKVTLHVSGTASIDEAGRTAHVGDFAGQAGRMLDNVASLLGGQGAGVEHVHSAVVYLRDAADASALREVFRARGFEGFPCAVLEAPLCRPELLCETEVVAVLPLDTGGA